jgi:hypothetical protein
MTITLYDAVVPSFLQTIGAVQGILERGLAHCRETGLDPEALVETRLAPDMQPLRFQLVSVAHHSAGALDGVAKGTFSPPTDLGPLDYAALQALVADAKARVSATTPEQLNGLAGADLDFRIGDHSLPFIAQDFLLSFSLPNFYFHVTTAYDILRTKGVPLGKRDFMGQMRLKR